MSEKATGFDWRMRSRYRLVHGAGASAYVQPHKPTAIKRKREDEGDEAERVEMIEQI